MKMLTVFLFSLAESRLSSTAATVSLVNLPDTLTDVLPQVNIPSESKLTASSESCISGEEPSVERPSFRRCDFC